MRVSHLALTVASAVLLAACAAPERRASAPSTLPPVVQQSAVDVAPAPMTPAPGLFERISRLAPDLDPGVLALALEARACALRRVMGASATPRPAPIRPTSARRLSRAAVEGASGREAGKDTVRLPGFVVPVI